MVNKLIAEIFNNIADILEIKNDNRFRINAYRRAALSISDMPVPLEEYDSKNALDTIPGIGKDLASKIHEYMSTGKIQLYEELKKSIPEAVLDFIKIPGVGPKTALVLFKELNIKSMEDLAEKAKSGNISKIRGIGDKTIQNILRGIDFLSKSGARTLLSDAKGIAEEILNEVKKLGAIEKIEIAGSIRRWKETIGDIDIIAVSKNPKLIMDRFVALPAIKEILAHGETKSSVETVFGIQVDLRIVKKDSYGACLAYLTGSKEHNVKLREIAVKKKMKINEYGLFRGADNKKIAGRNEEDMYKALGLEFVPPEMRENRGEIELAAEKRIPALVAETDLKSDLHIHTNASDGSLTLEEVVDIAKNIGYQYIAITDHSKTLRVARGLGEKGILDRIKDIDRLNRKIKGMTVLKGAEVDILPDGSMDYPDEILKELDFVIGAIHQGFKESKEQITRRIVTAMRNKYVHMIAHPTGRLLGIREAYAVDINAVLKEARDTNTAVEINANPHRLDLSDTHSRMAKDMSVRIGIGSDSHGENEFKNIVYGIGVARRGWLESKNIINTYPLESFLKIIKK